MIYPDISAFVAELRILNHLDKRHSHVVSHVLSQKRHAIIHVCCSVIQELVLHVLFYCRNTHAFAAAILPMDRGSVVVIWLVGPIPAVLYAPANLIAECTNVSRNATNHVSPVQKS
jgi:hypothetical protein